MKRFISSIFAVLLAALAIVSCKKDDINSQEQGSSVPFKSITATTDGETVTAVATAENHLALPFDNASDFTEVELAVELNDGYTVYFPEDLTKADLTETPVIIFKDSAGKQIRYFFDITTNAFPILDVTKISVVDAEGEKIDATLSLNTNRLVLMFDPDKIDRRNVILSFSEGALREGAEPGEKTTFDFTEGLEQELAIKYDGKDRIYNFVLDVASVIGDPVMMGFQDQTAQYVTPEMSPYVSIYYAEKVFNVPQAVIDNQWPAENPNTWSGYGSDFDKDDIFSFLGNWSDDRATVEQASWSNGEPATGQFAIVTVDISHANARLITNSDSDVVVEEQKTAADIVVGCLKSTYTPYMFYDNGTVHYIESQWDDRKTKFRSSLGIKDGKFVFSGAFVDGSTIKSVPWQTDGDHTNDLTDGVTDWDVDQAVWGYPWLVRDGHKLTSSEQAWNDGNRNRPESLGNAWQGCTADKVFAGITYDNKLGIAVTYRSGYWDASDYYQPGPNGYSVNQAAWVLDKLGWSDVINLSSDQNTKPVIYVNGKEVISLKKIVPESVEPNVRYCIAIDVE